MCNQFNHKLIENSEETQRYIRLEFSNEEIGFQKKYGIKFLDTKI